MNRQDQDAIRRELRAAGFKVPRKLQDHLEESTVPMQVPRSLVDEMADLLREVRGAPEVESCFRSNADMLLARYDEGER